MKINDKNILIIGNGFDLAIGYKTRYEDFMKVALAAKEKELDVFRKYIVEDWELTKCDIDLISSFYNMAKEVCGNNLIMDYFINYHSTTLSWADVETELMHIGQCLESVVSALQNENLTFYSSKDIEVLFENDLSHNSNYLSIFQDNEIFKVDVNGWYERQGQTFVNFSVKDDSILNGCKTKQAVLIKLIQELPKLFYKKLLDFSELFERYLKMESTREIPLFKTKYLITSAVTYNYTHNYTKIGCSAFHVNGEVLSDKPNGIIFGIDPDTTFRTTSFRNITKEMQRAAHNIKISAISQICRNADQIFIFGYSLTEADKASIKLIFKSVEESSFMTRVVIFYKAGSNDKENLQVKAELSNNLKNILENDFEKFADVITFKESENFFV